MKNVRKFMFILLGLTIVLSLCSCGSNGDESKNKNSDNKTSEKSQVKNSDNKTSSNSPVDGSIDGENDVYLFEYELTFDSKTNTEGAMISAIKDKTVKNVILPKTLVSKYSDPMPVLGLYRSAFANNDMIESVTIPDSYYQIQEAAFSRCTNLVNI